MKHITVLLLFVLLAACNKDAPVVTPQPCKSCSLTLINGRSDYSYTVTVDQIAPFTLSPAETKTVTIWSSRNIPIHGDLNTLYAGDDFDLSVQCNGDCDNILITMKHQ